MRINLKNDNDDLVVFFAFRYCLGRRTYAVEAMATFLEVHWGELTPKTQRMIHEEIKVALERDEAGSECDIQNWTSVLQLKASNEHN